MLAGPSGFASAGRRDGLRAAMRSLTRSQASGTRTWECTSMTFARFPPTDYFAARALRGGLRRCCRRSQCPREKFSRAATFGKDDSRACTGHSFQEIVCAWASWVASVRSAASLDWFRLMGLLIHPRRFREMGSSARRWMRGRRFGRPLLIILDRYTAKTAQRGVAVLLNASGQGEFVAIQSATIMVKSNSVSTARREFIKFLAASPYVAALGGVASFFETSGLAQSSPQTSDVITSPAGAFDVFDFEEAAHRKVMQGHWAYMASGVDDDGTLRANREGFKHIELRPRRLHDATKVDMRVDFSARPTTARFFFARPAARNLFLPTANCPWLARPKRATRCSFSPRLLPHRSKMW